jgi:ATP-dependent Clp protease, protease subunit
MTEHCLMFSEGIDNRTTNMLVAYLVDLYNSGATKLTLAVSSPGGNVNAGVTAYGALMSVPSHLETHNFGNVDSIAILLFLAGKTRYAIHGGSFLFHSVGFNISSNERLEENNLTERLDSVMADHKRISELISNRTGLRSSVCRKLFRSQSTKDTGWARKNGFIDDIRQFTVRPAPTSNTSPEQLEARYCSGNPA